VEILPARRNLRERALNQEIERPIEDDAHFIAEADELH
jgi:hypothetical protein